MNAAAKNFVDVMKHFDQLATQEQSGVASKSKKPDGKRNLVKMLQSSINKKLIKHKIAVDGFIGPQTRNALKELGVEFGRGVSLVGLVRQVKALSAPSTAPAVPEAPVQESESTRKMRNAMPKIVDFVLPSIIDDYFGGEIGESGRDKLTKLLNKSGNKMLTSLEGEDISPSNLANSIKAQFNALSKNKDFENILNYFKA